MFNSINSEIICDYTNTDRRTIYIEWRRYDGIVEENISSNEPYISLPLQPYDASGYTLYIDNEPAYWIYVIDYSLYSLYYPITFNDLQVSENQTDICRELTLDAMIDAPDLVYYDKNNLRRTLTRLFSLNYIDYVFGEAWADSLQNKQLAYPFSQITIDAPKQDVEFVLCDNFAKELNIPYDSITLDYKAVSVESHPKGTVEKRPEKNENKREGNDNGMITGSAPLVVALESRANTPTAAFFEWHIYDITHPENYRRYSDENMRYTFKDEGEYIAKLIVSSAAGCQYIDSVKIRAEEYTEIKIPNAFSPNEDGVNDEFRIAYNSIYLSSYKCVIYNRWGRVVYTGTDPQRGWDGRVNGRMSATGTYYYFIEVKRAKPNAKTEKYSGTVNLFSGKKR
ncbi:MAG: gliding motility-associated C-terminal domain-containing protein [Prevotellaceae bacterium]|nr:gliding motility-associated C-terminal domain-containing protein [Prevotellaceae bacterium]